MGPGGWWKCEPATSTHTNAVSTVVCPPDPTVARSSIFFEAPKSASLTVPCLSTRMLAPLMSLQDTAMQHTSTTERQDKETTGNTGKTDETIKQVLMLHPC
jgi:hypothetical protein